MENKIMLITYPDSLGGNLHTLEKALSRFFSREVGLVHILPFFPSSGDRGFAPITYGKVEEAFGDWTDIRRLGEQYGLMSDFMINHISRRSPQFLDYQKNRDASPYRELFLNWTRFCGGGPSPAEADRIYKRQDRDPYPNGKIHVIHTPGHTMGGVCFCVETDGVSVLVAGDTIWGGFSEKIGSDEQKWKESLDKLCSMHFDLMAFGHTGPVLYSDADARLREAKRQFAVYYNPWFKPMCEQFRY